MDYYTTISTVVSNNSQFLLLLTVLYCVLKIVHLEKEVKYLRFDHVCLKEMVLEDGENADEDDEDKTDEDDNDHENKNETKEELKDENYDPEEESSDTEEDELGM